MTEQRMLASARELRHIVGRFLHWASCPGYTVNAVRDAILAAEAEGYPAVSLLEQTAVSVPKSTQTFEVRNESGQIQLVGGGGLAYMLAPAFIDELALAIHQSKTGRVLVSVMEVEAAPLLAHLHEYAVMRKVQYSVVGVTDDTIFVEAQKAPQLHGIAPEKVAGPAMERVLRDGYLLPTEQYWRMFHTSNLALTPESEISRRHAGSQIYDEDGNVVGEIDEEAYQHIRRNSEGHLQEGVLA